MNYSRLPAVLVGVGLVIALYAVVSLAFLPSLPEDQFLVAVANLVSTVVFATAIVAAGWWLRRGDVPVERYPRIAGWCLTGLVFFNVFFAIVAVGTQDDVAVQAGILVWSTSAGIGGGALVGVFEARAIERATTAEEVRVRNDELQRQNERLEEFAGIVAHDLRNPLTIANAYVDDVRRDSDDERLDGALDALDRLDETISETLLLARAGRVVDDVEPVDLADVAASCWAGVQTDGARLDVTVEDDLSVDADRERLQRLFENLFRNSVEHGGGDVSVTVTGDEHGFTIADDGPGLPPEVESALAATDTENVKSFGLGLLIVQRVTSGHGWDLSVASSAEGTRFEVTDINTAEPVHHDLDDD